MTSSNGNIFRVTGHLFGEFTGPPSQDMSNVTDTETQKFQTKLGVISMLRCYMLWHSNLEPSLPLSHIVIEHKAVVILQTTPNLFCGIKRLHFDSEIFLRLTLTQYNFINWLGAAITRTNFDRDPWCVTRFEWLNILPILCRSRPWGKFRPKHFYCDLYFNDALELIVWHRTGHKPLPQA